MFMFSINLNTWDNIICVFFRAPFRQRYGYMYNSSNKNVNNYQVIILQRYAKGYDKYNIWCN